MKLIADSGSSKTDWALLDKGKIIKSFQTIGLNPYHNTSQEIEEIIKKKILAFVNEKKLEKVIFYGAGCTLETKEIVEIALKNTFKNALNLKITVHNDLLGAAHSVCAKNQGIVCILGTGSNACFFDGEKITQNSISLGWALGDEGSGNFLGKKLLLDWIYNKMPLELHQKFEEKFDPQVAIINHKLYKEAHPNKYLASFAPFLAQNSSNCYCQNLVEKAFDSFFENYILPYATYQNQKMYFVGSIAFHFSTKLKHVAQKHGFSIEKISQKPILGLILFHSGQS